MDAIQEIRSLLKLDMDKGDNVLVLNNYILSQGKIYFEVTIRLVDGDIIVFNNKKMNITLDGVYFIHASTHNFYLIRK